MREAHEVSSPTDGKLLSRWDRAVQEYYQEWWENPRDPRSLIFERLNDQVAGLLTRTSGERALDLGAGKGRIVSLLESQGFRVTAVEFAPGFVKGLRAAFPRAEVIRADLRSWAPHGAYDVATCIEVSQVLRHEELSQLLARLRPHVGRLLLNISNSHSLHGGWVRLRRFRAPFIVPYTPEDLRRILRNTGYEIVSQMGIGFVTPLSLLRDFRGSLVSSGMARRLSALDSSFPGWCHLFLVEAVRASDERWEA